MAARLSRELVVEMARRLLDEVGFEAFSMRALADALGASPMALYRHVASRSDLEVAVARAVSGEMVLEDDPTVPPDEAIAAWMRDVRAHWLRHPWFGHLVGRHDELSGFMVQIGTRLGRALRRAGADDRLVAREVLRITRTTLGVVLIEQAAPLGRFEARAAAGTDVSDRVAELVRQYDDDDLFDDLIHATVIGFRAGLDETHPLEGAVHVHH
jgi:AcrR family transcriptional regulator